MQRYHCQFRMSAPGRAEIFKTPNFTNSRVRQFAAPVCLYRSASDARRSMCRPGKPTSVEASEPLPVERGRGSISTSQNPRAPRAISAAPTCSTLNDGTPSPTISTGQSIGMSLIRGRSLPSLTSFPAVPLSMRSERPESGRGTGLRWRTGVARGGKGNETRRSVVTVTAFYPRKSADPGLSHINLTAKLRRREGDGVAYRSPRSAAPRSGAKCSV